MEKTINIDGKDIRFRSTGATPVKYKLQFGRDFFADIFKLESITDVLGGKSKKVDMKKVDNLSFDLFYNVAWVLAKSGDNSIPDPITWLDSFDTFPLLEIVPELQDLMLSSIQSQKKPMAQAKKK